jgi:DNA-binding transcriptional ArsR family regulator
MSKSISGSEMRDRLLARLKEPARHEEWVQVLAAQGNRDLLGLIARFRPRSIGALAELAGRAQPNVSRALNALVAANLVTVETLGRLSVPRITELGVNKARELGLLEAVQEPGSGEPGERPLFAVTFPEQPDANGNGVGEDANFGRLTTWIGTRSSEASCAACAELDLDTVGRHLLSHWWRMLYRRNAPLRLWDFAFGDRGERLFSFMVTAQGSGLRLSARGKDGSMLDLEPGLANTSVTMFERHLLDEIIRPIAARHRLCGRLAKPLHNLLARIEDSRSQAAEQSFCRAAGSLGVSPYDLGDDKVARIHELIDRFPDEDARLEFGSAVLLDMLDDGQHWISSELEVHGDSNRMHCLADLRSRCKPKADWVSEKPYNQGYAWANAVRAEHGFAADQPIGGLDGLSRILGAKGKIGLGPPAPGSLRGFLAADASEPVIIVAGKHEKSNAFVLARAMGDYLVFGSRAACVADLYTDRQAVGRAFAAELLAPRSAIIEMKEGEEKSETHIADHFGVSSWVIERQYENSLH